MDPLWLEINEAVHRREIIRAGQLIPRYIKAHRTSPEAIYEASEFYRKITDYSNALRVLPKERVIRGFSAKVSEAQTKLELQQARILNILGASKYALRVVDRIRAENRAKSKVEMVEIYHCNDKYADVLDLIGEDYPLPKSEPWHQDWLLHFYLAHALNGLKQRELAIKRVERIHFLSTSALIRAIALCCKGQYLVESNEPEKALPVLLESQSFFQDTDQTGDHAVLQKWLGICFLRLGRLRESETALKRAFAIFFQPALKPEDWMEIILWLDQIPGRVKPTQQFAPRLLALAGKDYAPLCQLGIDPSAITADIFSISDIEIVRKDRHLDRASDTVWKRNKPRLGLDLVDELILNLIYAGEYGLPQFRLYELLWSNELFSFDQHQNRLARLVERARKQGYKILWEDLHLRLLSPDVTSTGRPERVIRGHSFLRERAIFTRLDVEKYFSISRTSAIVLCRGWLNSSLIAVVNNSQYRPLI